MVDIIMTPTQLDGAVSLHWSPVQGEVQGSHCTTASVKGPENNGSHLHLPSPCPYEIT